MFFIVEIPIIVFVIGGMLVGGLHLGEVLRTVGWITLFLTIIALIVYFAIRNSYDKPAWLGGAYLLGITAVFCLALGYLIGDLNLFEFLFGTGWI